MCLLGERDLEATGTSENEGDNGSTGHLDSSDLLEEQEEEEAVDHTLAGNQGWWTAVPQLAPPVHPDDDTDRSRSRRVPSFTSPGASRSGDVGTRRGMGRRDEGMPVTGYGGGGAMGMGMGSTERSIDEDSYQTRKREFKHFLLETWRPIACFKVHHAAGDRDRGGGGDRGRITEEERERDRDRGVIGADDGVRGGLAARSILIANRGTYERMYVFHI